MGQEKTDFLIQLRELEQLLQTMYPQIVEVGLSKALSM